ncbi:hypothetical protein ACFVHB_09635 [Kitasatospora sp. NPDC127111]
MDPADVEQVLASVPDGELLHIRCPMLRAAGLGEGRRHRRALGAG